MTVKKPSNDDSSVIGPDDAKNLPDRAWPIHTTAAGQPDPSAAVASEIFALRSEVAKLNKQEPQDLSVSYDEIRGVLTIGDTNIKFKPSSKQGLVCGLLLRSKRNKSRSWTPEAVSKALDPSNPGIYPEDSILEAVRHINTKVLTKRLPMLISRSEGRVRIDKTYL